MNMPPVSEVRNRIETLVDDPAIQTLLKTVFLFGLRIGEACGYRYPSDKFNQPTGMLLWASEAEWQANMYNQTEVRTLQDVVFIDTGKEMSREEVRLFREKAFVLSIITEKREGYNRRAAIPMNPLYERWSEQVYKYLIDRQDKGPLPHLQRLTEILSARSGKPVSILAALKSKDGEAILESYEPIFPYRRQDILPVTNKLFEGFTYPIVNYNRRVGTEVKQDGQKKGVYEQVPIHEKQFGNHAIRHLRATEFRTFFYIKGEELDRFFGWTKPRESETSAMQDRYVTDDWRDVGYFPKLLRRRA